MTGCSMAQDNFIQILTAIGVILSLFIGSVGLYISYNNSRKTLFINSVTASRIKYIQELRNYISDFCGLVYNYSLLDKGDIQLSKERFEIVKSADKLKYLIQLYLNPEDTFWDNKMMEFIDEILLLTDKKPSEKIKELITITQYLLKLEWERAKRESQTGILNKKSGNQLYGKYVQLYKGHIKSQ